MNAPIFFFLIGAFIVHIRTPRPTCTQVMYTWEVHSYVSLVLSWCFFESRDFIILFIFTPNIGPIDDDIRGQWLTIEGPPSWHLTQEEHFENLSSWPYLVLDNDSTSSARRSVSWVCTVIDIRSYATEWDHLRVCVCVCVCVRVHWKMNGCGQLTRLTLGSTSSHTLSCRSKKPHSHTIVCVCVCVHIAL